MRRRSLPLLVLMVLSALLVMGALAGCDLLLGRQAAVQPTPTAFQPAPATQVPPTDVPPTEAPPTQEAPTAVPPTEVPPSAEPPPAAPEGPVAPELLDPPDEAVGTVMDLVWAWEEALADGQWFELYIWPDDPDAEPKVYGWYPEPPVRVTAANLLQIGRAHV